MAISAGQHATARAFKAALFAYGGGLRPALTSAQADGIIANAYRESGMNPHICQPDGSGQGLLQITGEAAHKAFAQSMGMQPAQASVDQQAEYLIRQFLGHAPSGFNEVRAYTMLSIARTAEEAADAFLTYYERSASAQAKDGKDAAKNRAFLPDLYGPNTSAA